MYDCLRRGIHSRHVIKHFKSTVLGEPWALLDVKD